MRTRSREVHRRMLLFHYFKVHDVLKLSTFITHADRDFDAGVENWLKQSARKLVVFLAPPQIREVPWDQHLRRKRIKRKNARNALRELLALILWRIPVPHMAVRQDRDKSPVLSQRSESRHCRTSACTQEGDGRRRTPLQELSSARIHVSCPFTCLCRAGSRFSGGRVGKETRSCRAVRVQATQGSR